MRAHDSRRPQPTSTRFCCCPAPRSLLCLLLLLFVVDGGEARSIVARNEEAQPDPGAELSKVESDPGSNLTPKTETENSAELARVLQTRNDAVENEKIEPEESGSLEGKVPKSSTGDRSQAPGEDNAEQLADRSPGRNVPPLVRDLEAEKAETIRQEATGIENSEILKQEDEDAAVAKKRRRNDAALKPEVPQNMGVTVATILGVKDEFITPIRRFDDHVDADEAVRDPDAVVAQTLVDPEQTRKNCEEGESSVEAGSAESDVLELEELKKQLPSFFRKSGAIDPDQEKENVDDEDENKNRGDRYLDDLQGKSRRKSSTVYLNAEEKKISDGEQQSIVDGQIKKLISIRDDALDAQKVDNLDEAKVLTSKRQAGLDEAAITMVNVRPEQENKVMTSNLFRGRQVLGTFAATRKRKEQAVALKDQIRNETFLLRPREQPAEVLPDGPKVTEDDLLSIVELVALSKRPDLSNSSYMDSLKDLGLTEGQLVVVRCAEQFLAVGERQPFANNMVQCVQRLSVSKCIRIFAWPILNENLPESVVKNFSNLPMHVNAFDLFQGNKSKSGRAQNLHQQIRLIAPESVVYNILQDTLEVYPNDQTLLSYVDPKNETLKELLTTNQLDILLMGEKLLPQAWRKEYSDMMFSCVRRFEYFSCIKYFAWPMIKQFFPALPAFPEYQSWYPVFDFYPQYPIFPFPPLSGEIGELPEVVDADATRSGRPRLEAIVIQVLENTMKEQPRLFIAPSFIDEVRDSDVARIPHDQLLSINMAEQLLPANYRPQFVVLFVECMKSKNYLTCTKATWPLIRRFNPTVPDIFGILPDFQIPGGPGIGDYVPSLPSVPSVPDLGSYWPFGTTSEQPEAPTIALLKNKSDNSQSPGEKQEAKIFDLLLNVTNSIDRIPKIVPNRLREELVSKTGYTKSQADILLLSEYMIPEEISKFKLEIETQTCRRGGKTFVECARSVIWPSLARYYIDLPEFPSLEDKESFRPAQPEPKVSAASPGEKMQERVIPEGEGLKAIANRFQEEDSGDKDQQNAPMIRVTGNRFVPLFTEHPENVILNIVRLVQLQSQNLNRGTPAPSSTTKNQQFIDLLNQQQINIVNIVDSLIPESIRTEFSNQLIACLRVNNFLVCTRDVIWPTLNKYFPWLPSFPNFGFINNSPSNATTSPGGDVKLHVLPLSETDVKTGQHGDTKVTITDTRFVPIFNEVPESVILNILKAVQLSLPNLPAAPTPTKSKPFSKFVTEQQYNILNIAESLLPFSARDSYVQRFDSCLRDRVFLQCVRDVTWPAIAQIYPWLPSFPNFGGSESIPRRKLQFLQPENSHESNVEENDGVVTTDKSALQKNLETDEDKDLDAETKIQILLWIVMIDKYVSPDIYPYSGPSMSHLNKRQQNIVKYVENGIPDAYKATYITRIQECTKKYNFLNCTKNISWPTLKSFLPELPDFSIIEWSPLQWDVPSMLPSRRPIDPLPVTDLPVQTTPGLSELPARLPGIAQKPLSPQLSGQSSQAFSEAQLLQNQGSSAFTPSVDNKGPVPGYAGQPPGIFVDISKDRVQLADIVQAAKESEIKRRERRSVVDLTKTYYETDETADSSDSSSVYPNITESEYLRLLIRMRDRTSVDGKAEPRSYYADTLNVTVRKSLTADQYEIIKVVEDVDPDQGRGIAQQVVNCIAGLSFIRCVGIFMWPLIVSQFPLLGFFGRSVDAEDQVQEIFGMSRTDFEKEMLERKDLIELYLLDWYKKIVEDKFQTNLGFVTVKGYGNGELGISFSGFREGRGAKLKDNKNLPSILTIISDIMEEVLDQRPEGEKPKREKEKKEKSIDVSRQGEIQFLKDSEEYVDIMRSMNDDAIITMFLDKIRTNDSDAEDGGKLFGLEDAYKAFEVLFGPRLHSKLEHKLQSVNHKLKNAEEPSQEGSKGVDIPPLEPWKNAKELLGSEVISVDVAPLHGMDQEWPPRHRQRRAKNLFKALFDKHSMKHLKDEIKQKFEEIRNNKIPDDRQDKDTKSGLVVKLPKLDEEFLPKKITNSVIHLGRAMKDKMMQMMPGLSLIFSFLLQMALAHARTAATMAGMISNMAMGSAIVGMIRDSFFGANSHPQIKYVYDNHKTGPGIAWPSDYGTGSHYLGL